MSQGHKCSCDTVSEVFYLDAAPGGFEDHLKDLDAANWMRLRECSECGTLWAIDEWDKYAWQVASRVRSRDKWSCASVAQRKELLVDERGGTTETPCICAGCDSSRVVGVAYCIDHLWETGATR